MVLEDGSAGEVSASLQFVSDGPQSIMWSLESDNGLIAGMSSGSISVAVRPQQSVAIGIDDVDSTTEDGTQFSVALTLDEGVDREVLLQVGYESGGATVFLQENNLVLQQGLHTLEFTLGDVEAERVVAKSRPLTGSSVLVPWFRRLPFPTRPRNFGWSSRPSPTRFDRWLAMRSV